MGKYPNAKVVPFSSVVGSSVTLHDPETERYIGQLGIMGIGGDTPDDWKQRSILVAEDTARRINAHDALVAAVGEIARVVAAEIDRPGDVESRYRALKAAEKIADAALAECAKPMRAA